MCLRNIKESWRKTPTTHIRLDPSPSTNIGRPPGPRRGHKKGTFGMIRLGDGRRFSFGLRFSKTATIYAHRGRKT